nr:66 kda cell surface adhesin for heparan sulfate [Staphylococcus aureus, Peptide Partial, 9 aa] [Staphylococcus aureus]
DWTGWLAAA